MKRYFSLALLTWTVACGPGGAAFPDDAGVTSDGDPSLDDIAGERRDAGAAADAGEPGEDDAGVDMTPAPIQDAGPVMNDAGPMLVEEIDHAFLIRHFGGEPVDAFAYADDVDGFQAYLDDVGVQYFSANEIVSPHNPGAAAQCGMMILLPTRDEWEKIGALALFSDHLRALVGEPIYMRNWWRPPCYNELVGGATGGDHPTADAVDLDFQSASSRAAAQQLLCEDYWSVDLVTPAEIAPGSDLNPRLNLSVGLGGLTIHLGVLSPGGRRFWKYGSYTVEPGSGDCW